MFSDFEKEDKAEISPYTPEVETEETKTVDR